MEFNTKKHIFIPGNVASSKNSKRWTGKYLISSEQTMDYKNNSGIFWIKNRLKFKTLIEGLNPPFKIGFYFIRKSAHKSDYVNLAQLPLDLMQKYNWIANDDMSTVIPYFLGYHQDKVNPGLIITIIDEAL